jgi:hypothetical protein
MFCWHGDMAYQLLSLFTYLFHEVLYCTLQTQNKKNSKHIFPEKELSCFSSISHIHVSVSDLYIPTIILPILLQENMWTKSGNM